MVGRWKPAPDAYRHVLDEYGHRPAEAALIAVHPWDVQGAIHAGLAGAWVNRTGVRYPGALQGPSVEGATFTEAVDELLREMT